MSLFFAGSTENLVSTCQSTLGNWNEELKNDKNEARLWRKMVTLRQIDQNFDACCLRMMNVSDEELNHFEQVETVVTPESQKKRQYSPSESRTRDCLRVSLYDFVPELR